MKVKTLVHTLLGLFVALSFAGCQTTVQNLTPSRLNENPSNAYTFSFKAQIENNSIIEESLTADLLINGEYVPMVQTAPRIFAADYRLPMGQSLVKYFFILEYDYVKEDGIRQAVYYSSDFNQGEPFESRVINRYVIQKDVNRGPVGSEVKVMGRNFSDMDTIVFGGTEVPTTFENRNTLTFNVPPMPAGETYNVQVVTADGELPAGNFRIDAAALKVIPGRVEVASGESEILIFRTDAPAPAGGLYVDVSTNIPESVIMPEVVIPEGAQSVNVTLEGGQPDSGRLVVNAPGYDETTIPVTVF